MRRERIASVVTALALVLAAVGGGLGPASVTQTASADFVGCDNPVAAVPIAAYNTVMGADSGCRWESGSQTDYENLTATDAYSSSLGLKDSADSYSQQVSNFQEDTRAVAYSKGKIEAVRALENESTESQAKQAANESVRDYYSQQQLAAINDWNAKVTQIKYLNGTALNIEVVRFAQGDTYLSADPMTGVVNKSYTLANGTAVTVKAIRHGSGQNLTIVGTDDTDDYSGYIQAEDPQDSTKTPILRTVWYGTEGTYNTNSPVNESMQPVRDLIGTSATQSQQVTDNLDPYITEVYNQYQAGDLNATDIVQNDPTLLAEQATTNYNSTGYYGYASVQLAAIGAAGDVNASHVISVDGGSNFTGTLFYTGEDRTTFQTGETYDFANLSGTVYLAASDGPNNASGIVNLNEKGSSFTIESATNTNTGENVDNTTVQKFVYETTDASALQSEIDRLEDLREFYQEQQANSGVGINLGTDDKAIIGVIAAVVLVLALRD